MNSQLYVNFLTRDGKTVRTLREILKRYPDSLLRRYAKSPSVKEIPIDLDSNTIIDTNEVLIDMNLESKIGSKEIPIDIKSDTPICEEIPTTIKSDTPICEEIPTTIKSDTSICDVPMTKICAVEIPLVAKEIPIDMHSDTKINEDIPIIAKNEIPIDMHSDTKINENIPIVAKEIPIDMYSDNPIVAKNEIPINMRLDTQIIEDIPIIGKEIPIDMHSDTNINEEIPIDMHSDTNINEDIPIDMHSDTKIDYHIKAILNYIKILHTEEQPIVYPNDSDKIKEWLKNKCKDDSVAILCETLVIKINSESKNKQCSLTPYTFIINLRKYILTYPNPFSKMGDRILLINRLSRKNMKIGPNQYGEVYIDLGAVLMTHFNSLPFFKNLKSKEVQLLNTLKDTGTEFYCLPLNFEFVDESCTALTKYIEYCHLQYAK